MALPNGVTVCSLSFGPYTDAEGDVQYEGMVGFITPSSPVRHIATGAVIVSQPVKVVIGQGGVGSVVLPQTDQAGIAPSPFTYTLAWQAGRFDSTPGNLTFALPVAAGPTVDFDTLIPTPAGVSVPTGVVSVNGKSGVVSLTAADVGAAPAGSTGSVASVNAKTGTVVLSASDVGADAAGAATAAVAAEVTRADGKYLATAQQDSTTATLVGTPASSTAAALKAAIDAEIALQGGGTGGAAGSASGLTAPIIKRGVYAPQGWGAGWYPAKTAAASQRVDVSWLGDSTTAGDVNGGSVTPITKLIRARSVAAGYTDGGRGAAPRGLSDSAADSGEGLPLVQSHTGFTSSDGYSVYGGLTPRSTTAFDTITFQGIGTRCRLLYSNFNNGGRFSYRINGGAWTPVDPAVPANIWVAGWLELTGLPGGGATNTVTVRNDGGLALRPLSTATSVSSTTGAGPAAGPYYYVLTVYSADKTQESIINSPGGGISVNGTQTVNGTVNNATGAINGFAYSTGAGRTFALYRGTSPTGPFAYLKDVPAAAGTQTTFTDDGTVTPTAGRTPPSTTPNVADGSTRNDVKVTAEFYNDTGIVYHNGGISGANAGFYFDVADTNYNQGAQALLGIGPSNTNADQVAASAAAGRRAPKLVVINFGINDLGNSTADTDSLTLADRLSLGIRMAQNAGADVLVLVPPLDVVNGTTAPPRARQGAFRKAIWDTGVSHGCAVIDLNVALGPTAGWATYGPSGTNPHPNATGYGVEADFIWNNLLKL